MGEATTAAVQDVPAHVPPDLVIVWDVYDEPGFETDFHMTWKALQDRPGKGIFWTPRNGGHWIFTKGSDISRAYADFENYSSSILCVPREFGEGFRLRPTTLDPPEHRPFRKLINAALTPRVVRSMRSAVAKITIDLIEQVRLSGKCDFVTDYADRLPIDVFMQLANLPAADAAMLRPFAQQLVRPDGTLTASQLMDVFADYVRPYVQTRRANPGDDVISAIVGDVDGEQMSEDEAIEIATVVLAGGLDTVASFLGFSMAFLATHREHREQLVRDPSLINGAVYEFLRRFPVVVKARLVKHDRVIDGVTLKADEIVVLPPIQGLDDREFENPLEVRFNRPTAPNATFGAGPHRCPGALLAHSELEITLREWLRRIPEFELAPGSQPEMKGGFVGGVTHLNLVWDPATTIAIEGETAEVIAPIAPA